VVYMDQMALLLLGFFRSPYSNFHSSMTIYVLTKSV
jgi:hypothetical protein